MKEVIVRLTGDHIKVKGGEYVRDYQRGEWIESGFEEIKCSVCGSAWDYCDNDCERFNFCPSCGCDMRKESE